jgi:hypothetical protein
LFYLSVVVFTPSGQFSGTLELHTLSPWAELVKANQPLLGNFRELLTADCGSLIVIMQRGSVTLAVLRSARKYHFYFDISTGER